MKKIFIKYNPYKIETEITVDGKRLAQNSKIGEKTGKEQRLQEYVEELPQLFIDEYNDTDFEVQFHGTLLDYEDLADAFTEAYKQKKLTAKLERIPAKETTDKEVLIDKVFKEIQKGPFDELRDADIKSAFKNAQNSEFEVCTVATMSAGKSTLINAMMGTKLMPSKQEACTAIITRIKDKDISGGDKSWQAEVYDKESKLVGSHKKLTYKTMGVLNSDENVSEIKIIGDIPFVASNDVSLVLIDTPGPNNSRDKNHRKVQSKFLGESSKALVLYIMTPEFGTDDDNALLSRVAESMAIGGKQSKDRFIFVVNKLDDRKKEDGNVDETLERVREYLKLHGIVKPNLFPAAALPALNIRLIESGAEIDEDTLDETEMKVKKLNRNASLHFENYAQLPMSLRATIDQELADAIENKDVNTQALIHTGVKSVEAAIRQYVEKYAKTAKIKNIVNTFDKKMAEVGFFEKIKEEISKNTDDSEKIANQIDNIQEKIKDANSAKDFKDAVAVAVKKVKKVSEEVVDNITEKFQKRITTTIKNNSGSELTVADARYLIDSLESFSKKQELDFEEELDRLIHNSLVAVSNNLFEEYRKKIAALTNELDINELAGIDINPLKLMQGCTDANDLKIEKMVETKDVEDGFKMVEVSRTGITSCFGLTDWFFGKKKERRTQYKTVEYINSDVLVAKYFAPIKKYFYTNGDEAVKYADEQAEKIASQYKMEFNKLDDILTKKLNALKSCAQDKENADKRIVESKIKLEWLASIKNKVESILEI